MLGLSLGFYKKRKDDFIIVDIPLSQTFDDWSTTNGATFSSFEDGYLVTDSPSLEFSGIFKQSILTGSFADKYTFLCDMRANTAFNGNLRIIKGASPFTGVESNFLLTSEWQRYSITITKAQIIANGMTLSDFRLGIKAGTHAGPGEGGIIIRRPSLKNILKD